jgi:hypothetical protein
VRQRGSINLRDVELIINAKTTQLKCWTLAKVKQSSREVRVRHGARSSDFAIQPTVYENLLQLAEMLELYGTFPEYASPPGAVPRSNVPTHLDDFDSVR